MLVLGMLQHWGGVDAAHMHRIRSDQIRGAASGTPAGLALTSAEV
jgi:hypothetical protein